MARARGFHRMADLMTAHTDLAIFRRFLSPNILSLLYAQAEILELCDDLRCVLTVDRKNTNRQGFERDWFALKTSLGSPEPKGDEQYKKVMQLRAKLKDYSIYTLNTPDGLPDEFLLTVKQSCHLAPVDKTALDALRTWLGKADGGYDVLCGTNVDTWDAATEFDLTSLTGRYHNSDALSKLINGKLVPWLQDHVFSESKTHTEVHDSFSRGREKEPVAYYSDTHVAAVVATLTTTLACLIQTASIFALYFIHSDILRMSAIVGFTFLFAVTVVLTTVSKRVECFTATAAFSAVLVVFISNTNGGSCTCGTSSG